MALNWVLAEQWSKLIWNSSNQIWTVVVAFWLYLPQLCINRDFLKWCFLSVINFPLFSYSKATGLTVVLSVKLGFPGLPPGLSLVLCLFYIVSSVLLLFGFQTWSHSAAHAGLMNFLPQLLSVRIIDMYHHIWLYLLILEKRFRVCSLIGSRFRTKSKPHRHT